MKKVSFIILVAIAATMNLASAQEPTPGTAPTPVPPAAAPAPSTQIPVATKVPGAVSTPSTLPNPQTVTPPETHSAAPAALPPASAPAVLPQAGTPPTATIAPPPPTTEASSISPTPPANTSTEVITVTTTTTTQKPTDPLAKKSILASQFRKLFAQVKTDLGDFRIELFHSQKPITVENFVKLAEGSKEFRDLKTGRNIRRPFYNGLVFHRAIRGTLIQSGCPFGDGRGGPGYTIEDESNDFGSVEEGAVLMARSSGKAKNSAGSQFYIMLRALPDLTDQDTIFGKVVEGIGVIRKISEAKVDRSDRPIKPISIKEITIQKE